MRPDRCLRQPPPWASHALALALLLAAAAPAARAADGPDPAQDIVRSAGVEAGLCVHLGTTDGQLETALARSGQRLVHGLALDDATLAASRAAIQAAGLYGLASVEKAPALDPLPYADNLVNLLVADLDALGPKAPPQAEVLRVLCPKGVAYLKKGGAWTRTVKPRPKEMDDWTHFDYGPEGNGVSHDRRVAIPTSVQWMAGVQEIQLGGNPAGFHVFTSTRVADGRAFFEWADRDEKNRRRTFYTGRDAFNGLPLWTLPNTAPGRKDWQFVAAGDRLYTFLEKGGPLAALDGATGRAVRTYERGGALTDQPHQNAIRYCAGTLLETAGPVLYALDARTGDLLWKHEEPNGALYFPSATAKDRKVFVAVGPEVTRGSSRWPVVRLEAIVCLDLADGKVLWRCTEVAGGHIGQLVYDAGNLALFGSGAIGGGEEPYIGNLRASDGRLLWHATFQKKYNRFGYNMLVRDATLYYADAWRIYAHDLATGRESVPFDDRGYNMRCNRFCATEDLLIFGLVAYVDQEFRGRFQSITRSGCAIGAVPANGMLYFTPNACGCITQLRGHIALAPEPLREPAADAARLERGREKPAPSPPGPVTRDLPAGPVAEEWLRQSLGAARETEPVRLGVATADDLAAVAVVHQHRLEARDASGQVVWAFTAGGRISGQPVVARGLVYFGSHDGWVYCVRSGDGQLLWRFMAAPYERKIVAWGQLESAWPVPGVVMHEGKVCCAAGLHPEAGGGLYVYGLEPDTGAVAWKKVLRRAPVAYDGKERITIRPNRILGGILKSEGDALSLPGITFRPGDPDEAIQKKVDGEDPGEKKRAMLKLPLADGR